MNEIAYILGRFIGLIILLSIFILPIIFGIIALIHYGKSSNKNDQPNRHNIQQIQPQSNNTNNATIKIQSPYIICDKLLTNHELSFYKDLRMITDDLGYVVMCKVRLADIALIPYSNPNKNKLFNAVKAKHLDFVICSQDTTPLFAIELDDYTHDWESTKQRDEVKNNIFINSKVKLLRYRKWSIEQIRVDLTTPT